jgi:Mn-dependent DtxR family transcriptional regulator
MGMTGNQENFRTFRGYALARPADSLTASMEDYLEMICRLCEENGFTRVNDLARVLNVKPSSVTSMLHRLLERELIVYEKYGVIVLTPRGKRIGRRLLQRHDMLEKFFSAIGVRERLLENVECIEHNLTPEAIRRLSLLVEYIEAHPDWFSHFQNFAARQPG